MEGALPSSLPMRASRWPTVLMVVGAGVVAAFQIGKAPAALPVLRADLGLSLVAAGWVISMFNVIGMAVGMIAGAAADRIGHRRVVLMGLGLVAAASLAGAGANGAGVLLLGRFFEGLGFIGVVVAAPVLLIGATSPRDLGLAFGVWGGYMPTGTALMLLASPVLLAPFGWRGLWLANGALAAVFALALAAATRDLGRPPAAPPGGGARALSGDIRATVGAAGPVTLALAFASYTLQFLAVLGFLPTILVEQEGFSQALAAALTSFAVAVNVAGNLAAGFLIQRGVPRWALMATASAAMALCSVGIYDPGLAFATRYG
ncbi:MAG: MFS transporter, partial [Pseudomonadota bacterium]